MKTSLSKIQFSLGTSMDKKINSNDPDLSPKIGRNAAIVRFYIDIWIIFTLTIFIDNNIPPALFSEFFIAAVLILLSGTLVSIKLLAAKSGRFRFFINSSIYVIIICFLFIKYHVQSPTFHSDGIKYYSIGMISISIFLCIIKIILFYSDKKIFKESVR